MRIVILGGVAAGMSAASEARRRQKDAEIVVFEKGHDVSYGACGLPYKLADRGDLQTLVQVTAEEFRRERGIDLQLGYRAVAVDTGQRAVTVRGVGGIRQERYDRLVIATGARAVSPDLPGIDLPGVFQLRTLDDGRRVEAWLAGRRRQRALIVGGGYVGLEMVESLHRRGLEVTLLEHGPRLMRTYEPAVAEVVRQELEAHQVTVRYGQEPRAIEADGTALRVQTGEATLSTDLVLLAVGIRPNSEVASAAGLALGPGEAIRVDASQRTSAPDVYAAGDCAVAYHRVLEGPAWIPLGTTANRQGKVAGANAAGGQETFLGIVGTAAFKVFGVEVGRTGLGRAELERAGRPMVVSESRQPDHAASAGSAARPVGTLTTVLFTDPTSGKLLGAQMAGRGVVGKRIDVLATALHAGLTVAEVAQLDLCYAPPIAPVHDPVVIAGRVAVKDLRERSAAG